MRFFWRRRQPDISLNDPLLTDEDGSSETYRQPGDLDDLVSKFGRSLLNASPKDISRLRAAVENDNTEEILEIIGTSVASVNTSNDATEFSSIDISQDSLFKMAVDECKTEWVKFFLEKIADKSILFVVGAAMMKENLNNLWLYYRFHLEDMIKNDVFGWDICKIDVPLETFTTECNMGSRVGTCNTITEWLEASEAGIGHEHWRSLNPKGVDRVLKKSKGRKVNAIVRVYCFENACQIGIDGIVRFLLLHKAPSCLFKTPLIRWIITLKWERIWRVLAFKRLASFLLFFVGFHIFAFVVTLERSNFDLSEGTLTLANCCCFMMALLPILTLRLEYFQLKRCMLDSRKIFSSNWFRGIRIYFSSRPNQIDLMLSVVTVLIVRLIGIKADYELRSVDLNVFFGCLTLEMLLIWAKAFYLSQALERTGIFVIIIGRVLKDCATYFLLLLGITTGFGFVMHVLFIEYMREKDFVGNSQREDCLPVNSASSSCIGVGDVEKVFDNEDEERIETSFGSLFLSVLTMAYAMVGLFDPEVLFHCGSPQGLMIVLFVLYLFLQTIVMFNVLIASMGDAFDGVRAEEEELFLMARAMFIDQYEASLSNTAIRKMKMKIGKYLYVLIPEDKQLTENVPFWKGRISTIKEDVTKIARDSQNQLRQNIDDLFKILREDIKNDMRSLEERITKSMEERFMRLEQRINDENTSR